VFTSRAVKNLASVCILRYISLQTVGLSGMHQRKAATIRITAGSG